MTISNKINKSILTQLLFNADADNPLKLSCFKTVKFREEQSAFLSEHATISKSSMAELLQLAINHAVRRRHLYVMSSGHTVHIYQIFLNTNQ